MKQKRKRPRPTIPSIRRWQPATSGTRWWQEAADKVTSLDVVALLLVIVGFLIAVFAFALPPFRGSAVLQFLGSALVGAGFAALLGIAAVRQQSAKEANLTRKRETYGPLYAELKALRIALADAKEGKAPAPMWIDTGATEESDEGESDVTMYLAMRADIPTLKCWPAFRRDYRDTDFTPRAQQLLDAVHELATRYNNGIETARLAAIPILQRYVQAAISEEQQSTAYQDWKQPQAPHRAAKQGASRSTGRTSQTAYDWFGYFDESVGTEALQWLTFWPAGPSALRSLALGWLLARQPNKAARYVQYGYPADRGTYPRPPLDWIHHIFDQAWPTLLQDNTFSAAIDTGDALLKQVQEAEQMVTDGLRRIQERYEGGAPLV